MTSHRDFPPAATSVRAARRFASEALPGSPGQVLDDVQLMVSELATNVVQHVTTGFSVMVHGTKREIRVEVSDRGGGVPVMRSHNPAAPGGRGLQIIELLSTHWGVSKQSGTGKTVWFTVALPPPDRPLPALPAQNGRRSEARP